MSWSFNIGSIAGTQVRIHVTFVLFLAWIFAASYASGGADAAWSATLFLVLLFFACSRTNSATSSPPAPSA